MNLTRFDEQKQSILSHIKANLLGSGNLSIRGLAFLCQVSPQSIINGSHFKSGKLAEIFVSQGIESAHLIENGFDAKATWLVIEYFAYHSKAKAEGAKKLARTFGSYGIHEIFKKLNEKEEPKRQLPPVRDAVDYMEAAKGLPSIENPMLRSILEQRLMEEAGHFLLLREEKKQMCILTVRAKELGYKESQIGTGSSLGKYVAQYLSPEGKQQHGRYKVNTYLVSDRLDECIHSYFR